MNYLVMSRRNLQNWNVSSIGYGCMGLSHGYGPTPTKEESIEIIKKAFEIGYTHFDTAEAYGKGENEILWGEATKAFRDRIEIATKLHILNGTGNDSGNIERTIREHLDASLSRLQTDHVELYYLHRYASFIDIEEVARVMGLWIKEKKIGGWGLSQVSADIIRKAHKITPWTAIQSEYSIMERMFEQDVLPTCKELNIGFVAFSPLASGFWSGGAKANEAYVGDDVRRVITRFKGDNVKNNQPLMGLIEKYAKIKNCTTSQFSLAWMMKKYPFVVPIPGTKNIGRMWENAKADAVEISDDEFGEFEKELSGVTIFGNRTDEDISKLKSVPIVVDK